MSVQEYEVRCPTCSKTRLLIKQGYWQVISPKGRASGDCKSCSLRKKTYPGRKNPGGIRLHDPLANSLFMTKFYKLWVNMRNRCENPNNRNFKHYGGRGIYVCDRWQSFEKFVIDMYDDYIEGISTIERIDNDGPYSPDNCRWATRQEQSINTRHNVFLTHNGRRMTISQWSRELGINRRTIRERIKKGYTTEQILTPVLRKAV